MIKICELDEKPNEETWDYIAFESEEDTWEDSGWRIIREEPLEISISLPKNATEQEIEKRLKQAGFFRLEPRLSLFIGKDHIVIESAKTGEPFGYLLKRR